MDKKIRIIILALALITTVLTLIGLSSCSHLAEAAEQAQISNGSSFQVEREETNLKISQV